MSGIEENTLAESKSFATDTHSWASSQGTGEMGCGYRRMETVGVLRAVINRLSGTPLAHFMSDIHS